MEVLLETWSCSMAFDRKHLIDPQPQYQRGPVWTNDKQQLLIDSILRGYDIPKIYLTKRSHDDATYHHEVTDGQQRLRAIWSFMEDDLALGATSEDIPGHGDLSGKTYSQLEGPARDRVKLFRLSIAEIRDASEIELRELFLRLQKGTSLNPAEKRNAILGGMRDFIAVLGEEHPAFPMTRLSSERFGWHNLAAHVTRLELAEGPVDVKAPDLFEMYNNHDDFDAESHEAQRVAATLDYMAEVLRDRPPEMRIKWGFVDLYLLISDLMHRSPLDIQKEHDRFLFMFQSLEEERLAVDDPADLIIENSPSHRDLFDYIEAFSKQAGTKDNIATRRRVYRRRMALELPAINELDD